MSIYAIGDIQGCFDELLQLLSRIRFDPGRDRLWFAGDLVNRGPKSLQVLRFVKSLGRAAVSVLGNHDLHLLAVAAGNPQHLRHKDTLEEILSAPDRDELLTWLRHRPLLHRDTGLGYTLIHAGLPPQWDLKRAEQCAAELEAVLRGPGHGGFFANMYGNLPDRWSPALEGWDRLRFITNCFTRLRYCAIGGRLALKEKAAPGSQQDDYRPWFAFPGRNSAGERIVFGHWSTLELKGRVDPRHNVFPLDNGCIWGGHLTTLHLPSGRHTDMACPGWRKPATIREHTVALRAEA